MVRSHVVILCMLAALLVAVAVLRSVVLSGTAHVGGEVEGEEDGRRSAGGLVVDSYNAGSPGRWVYATTAGPP